MNTNKILRILSTITATLWAGGALAAVELASQPNPFDGISIMLIIVLLALSTAMGGTSLLLRLYLVASKNTGSISLKWLLITSHMACSWAAGVIAFVYARHAGMAFWGMVGTVLLSSFAGVQALEMMVASRLGGFFRVSPTDIPTQGMDNP